MTAPVPAVPPANGPPAEGPLPDSAVQGQPPPLARDASWHRLHPLSPFVRAGRRLMSLIVVLIGISVLNQHQDRGDLVGDVLVIVAALVGGFVSWLVTRWQIADGVLRVDTGLLRRDSRRFPLSQVQAIDVVQSGLARLLGLAELQLRVAGGDSARGGRLACLRLADAEQLRRQLLALAAISSSGPGAPAAGGAGVADPAGVMAARTLFRVRTRRLPVAILLTRAGATALIVSLAAWLTVQVSGSAAVITPFLPVVLGVVAALWRQFNSEYGTTVWMAQDGIRLRSGLIQTTAETIRPGRIQAVRLVEPLVWRAFGWCRLEVDVAGARQRGEDRSEGQRLRAFMPVGSKAEADLLLAATAGRPAAAVSACTAAGPVEGAAQLPLPELGRERAVRRGRPWPALPGDHLGSAGEGAEHPLGAGPAPAQAWPRDRAPGRGWQAGQREDRGPGRRGGPADPGRAAGPRQGGAVTRVG